MIDFSWQKYGRFTAALLAGGIILFWGLTRPPHFAIDDAYITYRYAQNLRQGVGFVYNAGEPVLGTTAPMYAMILAILSFVVPNLELLGHWLSILSWGAAAFMSLPLLLKLKRPFAATLSPILIALQSSILKSVGMETPFLLFLMFFVAWSWLDGCKKTAVVAGAVLLITRQDSALWLFVLGLAVWQREKRLSWRVGVGVVGLALPWFAFAAWRYGSILPNSAVAKIGQTSVMVVGSGIPFWQRFGLLLTERALPVVSVLLITAVLAWLLDAVMTRQWTGWWLLTWVLAYTAVYSLLDVVNFNWYFVPPVAVAMLLVSLGVEAVARWIQQLVRRKEFQHDWLGPGAVTLLLIPLLLSFGLETWRTNQTPGVRADYFQIGQWLAENTTPDSSVATIEIGVIGYESGRPIVDTMGLVSPGMTSHQVGWLDTLVYALDAYDPAYLVVLPNTAWDGLLPQWWFQQAYEPVMGLENATIFQRKSDDGRAVFPADISWYSGLRLDALLISTIKPQVGDFLNVWLKIQVKRSQPTNYQPTLYLVDEQGQRYAVTKDFPFNGGYQSSHWQPGDQLEIPMQLELPSDLPAGGYQIGIIMFDPEQGGGLPLASAPDQLSPDVRVGWLRLGDPAVEDFDTAVSLKPHTVWQESLTLNELNIGPAQNGALPVQLVWQVGQPLTRNLTTFIHLLDAQGNILTQVDERPFQGQWPTPVWQAGETIFQTLDLPLPAGVSLGDVQLRVGLYDGEGRLFLADASGDFWQTPIALQPALP